MAMRRDGECYSHVIADLAARQVSKRCCSSSHGSTKSSQTDPTLKTRHFVDIVAEITKSMEIHKAKGTILGGVHLELTGEINENGFSVVGKAMLIEAKV